MQKQPRPKSVKKKPKAKKNRCKGKGQQFERKICRLLSLWVSRGKSKNLFWRSSQSGGRATTLRKRGEKLAVHAGDIAAIDPAGVEFISNFFIECKFYKDLHWARWVNGLESETITPHWRKCCKQAAQYHKLPLLICKDNHHNELICVDNTMYIHLCRDCVSKTGWDESGEAIFIYGLTKFLQAITAKDLIAFGKSCRRSLWGRSTKRCRL